VGDLQIESNAKVSGSGGATRRAWTPAPSASSGQAPNRRGWPRYEIPTKGERSGLDVTAGEAALLQILLVIILGGKERYRGNDLGRDGLGITVRLLQCLF
jgi:hypothetical protein